MSDVSEIAGAVSSVSDLVAGILDRADRDGPQKELNENINRIQNAFAENDLDSDSFRLFVSRLCNDAGKPLTPGGDVHTARREYLHSSLLAIAELAYARKIIARIVAKQTK